MNAHKLLPAALLLALAPAANADLLYHYTFDTDTGNTHVNLDGLGTVVAGHENAASYSTTETKFGSKSLNLSGGDALNLVDTTAGLGLTYEGGFTVSFHMKDKGSAAWKDYLSVGDNNGSAWQAMVVEITDSNTPALYAKNYSDVVDSQVTSSSVVKGDNAWHHIAITFDGSIASLFVDGALQGASSALTRTGSIEGLQLGDYLGRDRRTFAYIDDVALYSGVLSSTQVSWLSSNVANATASAVPEPSTYGLMGAGALASAMLVRRRRRVKA